MRLVTEDNQLMRPGDVYYTRAVTPGRSDYSIARITDPRIVGTHVEFTYGDRVYCADIRTGGVVCGVYASSTRLADHIAWLDDLNWTLG